ncbi:unnamed protein product [Nippostrongylus brasiliensis]|uniref:Myb-like domain-containing protein n=1 Tax=Nippostrongylus brasiliensis TaxID=27835 RepID=A0A0N4XUR4_NIPBR|nr:unnamed protein product [Nippostrongylus brasiliensis]
MNTDGPPATTIAPTMDLHSLLATMPDFSMLPSLSTVPKDSTTGAEIPTSQQLLFPPIPNDQLAALSLAVDSRPRAFSSAAALQRPKRSRKAQADEQSSVLRMLVDEEDDAPLKLRPSTKDLDEKLRQDAAKVLNESSPPPAKRASPDRLVDLIDEQPSRIALRRIIRDEDLPDSIGPDSPFRHHPKYQRKPRDSESEMDGMEALTAFCVVNGYVPESGGPSPSPKNDSSSYATANSPKKSFSEIMDHAICRELVTAE